MYAFPGSTSHAFQDCAIISQPNQQNGVSNILATTVGWEISLNKQDFVVLVHSQIGKIQNKF